MYFNANILPQYSDDPFKCGLAYMTQGFDYPKMSFKFKCTRISNSFFLFCSLQVPPISTANSITIKSENISSGSSASSTQQKSNIDSNTNIQINAFDSPYYSPSKSTTTTTTKKNVTASPSSRHTSGKIAFSALSFQLLKTLFEILSLLFVPLCIFIFCLRRRNFHVSLEILGTSPLPLTHTTQTTTSVASTSSHTKTTNAIHSVHDITSGCSRTIPISWNNSSLLQVCLCVCDCFFLSFSIQFFCSFFSHVRNFLIEYEFFVMFSYPSFKSSCNDIVFISFSFSLSPSASLLIADKT